MVIGEPVALRPSLAMAPLTALKLLTMVSNAESHMPEPATKTMVFSAIVTSSPNGSSEVAAGGTAAGGACAAAVERTEKLVTAAATADNHQIRAGIIGSSPASPSAKALQRTRHPQPP